MRRRRGWRQIDLGVAANCSQNLVSLVERGHLDRISLHMLRSLLAALDAIALIELRWRGAALDRLLDETHALVLGSVAGVLRSQGWIAEVEVTYSEYGERGSFDILAFHPTARVVLVIEVKTDLPSAEATLRKLDEKGRLAADVARKRFGWRAASVARLLVLPESSTLRGRVANHAALFNATLPQRNVAIRGWLAKPIGTLSGLCFLSHSTGRVAKAVSTNRARIRKRGSSPQNPPIAA